MNSITGCKDLRHALPHSYIVKEIVSIEAMDTGYFSTGISIEPSAIVFSQELRSKFHSWAASHISHFARYSSEYMGIICNGSCYFIAFGDRLFMVSAAHVFDEGMKVKRNLGKIPVCRVGHHDFNPEARLQSHNRELDIVTFAFTYDELSRLQKQAIIATHWPPPAPIEKVTVLLGGFPGIGRRSIGYKVGFGRFIAQTPVTSVNERNIICRFNRDNWTKIDGIDLPAPGCDLGGISGGPLLLPYRDGDGVWHLFLGGTISEAQTSLDYVSDSESHR